VKNIADVWIGKAYIDPSNREVIFEPKDIMELKEWKSISDENWKNLETLLEKEEPFELDARLGGGVIPVYKNKNPSFTLLQRSKDAPREPYSVDAPSGIDDATLSEVKRKLLKEDPLTPQIPVVIRLLSELFEIMPVEIKDGIPIYHIHSPTNLHEDYRNYIESTGITTAYWLASLQNLPQYSIWVNRTGRIGKFKDGWTFEEKIGDKKEIFKGVLITFEPPEKSIEVVFPYEVSCDIPHFFLDSSIDRVKIRGREVYFLDGEYIGEPEFHQMGMINSRKLTPLNRYVLLLYEDGKLKVFKGGELEFTGDFEEYAKRIGLAEAILTEETYGMTSKVKELYRQAKRGNYIEIDGRVYSLSPFKAIGDYIEKLRKTKS
jgi:hypothetical protein